MIIAGILPDNAHEITVLEIELDLSLFQWESLIC